MNLYELTAELRKVEAEFDRHAAENDGDMTNFNFSLLEGLQEDIDTKLLNVGSWIKNLEAESKAFDNEKEVLARKKEIVDNKIKSLTGYVSQRLNGKSLKDSRVSLGWRKSNRISIPIEIAPEDLHKYPNLINVKTEFSYDKKAIKEYVKEFPLLIDIDGKDYEIKMESFNNLQIK